MIFELLGLTVLALATSYVQLQFPVAIAPNWLLSGSLGMALVASYLQGYRGAMALAIGVALSWFWHGPSWESGISTLSVIIEAFVLASLIRTRGSFLPSLERPREVLVFSVLAVSGACVRSLVIAFGALLMVSIDISVVLTAFSMEWLATILIAPIVLLVFRTSWNTTFPPHRILEGLSLIVLTALMNWYGFASHEYRTLEQTVPLLAVILGLATWVAFRFTIRGMVCLITLVGMMTATFMMLGAPSGPVALTHGVLQDRSYLFFGISGILTFLLVIASVAKDYSVREGERELLISAARQHADRLVEVNSRLSQLALKNADQTEELQRQRDEYKNLARELSEKQAQFLLLESAVVNAQDAIIILEPKPQEGIGRAVLYVNEAFTRITGYSSDEVVGRSLHFLRGERTDANTLSSMREAMDEFRPFNCELLNYHRNGAEVWVSLSIVPVRNSSGECSHFVMIQHDITDRKVAEHALLESEAKFRGIFETASAGVSITDASGEFTSCNPAFAAMLGLTPEQVVGRHPYEFSHPEEWEKQRELHEQLINGQIDHYQVRKRYQRPDGLYTWTELSLAAVRSADGVYQSGLGVSVDVSTRMNLEDQLRQSQKMEALGQLAGGVAHDFNNLLTAVLGNLALIRLPESDPAIPMLRTVELAASRAADLTRKLLGYARRNQLMVTPILPRAIIHEVVDILRRTIDPRIEIVTSVRTDQSVGVDATLLNQALINLCLNARDAMPEGGRLTITADESILSFDGPFSSPDARPGRFVRLTVSDTGHGMDEKVRQRVFEPFFTTKGVGRGTGLGLPMVHGILKQHGGWVSFHSEVGMGTTFELYLPVLSEESELTVPQTNSPQCDVNTPSPQNTSPSTILLVDDEDMIRVLGRTILETNGYRILEAVDGMEAVELYRTHAGEIDLVIMDVTMPRLSGRDAFQQIRELNSNALVLFSSGFSTEDLSDIDGSLGMLSKPYRPRDLLAAVFRALQNIPITMAMYETSPSHETFISS